MIKYINCSSIFFFLIITPFASSLNAEENNLKYGWAPTAYSLAVDDPDGETKSEAGNTLLSAIAKYDIDKLNRLYITIDYLDFKLSASPTEIGQNVKSITTSATYQHKIKLLRNFSFHAGYGFFFGSNKYSSRHNVDSAGFLTTVYANREEEDLGLKLNIANEWDVSKAWSLGYELAYLHSLNSGISGLFVRATSFF